MIEAYPASGVEIAMLNKGLVKLVSALYGALIILAGALAPGGTASASSATPRIVDGTLDLSGWNAERDSALDLTGKWEFHWAKLLAEDHFAGNPTDKGQLVDVPKTWVQYRNENTGEKGYPGFGYATYRLKINHAGGSEFALKIPAELTAIRVLVGGKTVAESGYVSADPDQGIPRFKPQVVTIPPMEGDFNLIIQVSNYTYARGGLYHPIYLGSETKLLKIHEENLVVEMITLATLLVMGGYHLAVALFLRRRVSVALLIFGACCLTEAARILFIGESFIYTLIPDVNFHFSVFVEHATYYFGMALMILFFRELYPECYSSRVVYVLAAISGCFVSGTIVLPVKGFTQISPLYHFVTAATAIYAIVGLSIAVKRRREGAALMLSGLLIFIATVAHDIVLSNNWFWIVPRQLVAYGLFVFTVLQALAIAKRFTDSFRAVETLSVQLTVKDRIKDEFLANTSHELNTPLHGIINLTQSLSETAESRLSPSESVQLQTVITVARRLSLLIRDIMDFTRLKNRDIELNKRSVDLRMILESNADVFRHYIGKKSLRLSIKLPEHLPKVYADENRLLQILYNLIGNAIKFTEQGEIIVAAADTKDGFVRVSISDTGIGIPADKLADIFQTFEQIGATVSKEYGGTGLGLGIARRLVELHGGRITVESEGGKGSVFTFSIPQSPEASVIVPMARHGEFQSVPGARAEQEAAAGEATHQEKSVSTRSHAVAADKYKVMIVDDDPVNIEVLCSALRSEGCHLHTFTQGNLLLEYLDNGVRVDLIILDAMMPGLSGYAVCRQLRKQYTLAELPILLVTARNELEDMLEGFAAGANDFLTKPFHAYELKARVRTLLGMRNAAEEALRSEIAFLQAQIKPHFLYNSLNSILSLSLDDPAKSRQLLLDLGEYLRHSFDFGNLEKLVPLGKELGFIRSYVTLEQARFGKRLQVAYEIEDLPLATVPPLMIQPVVENAIQHGALKRREGGLVTLTIKRMADELEIRVVDNGPGFPAEQAGSWLSGASERGGTGLRNVQQRLLRMYSREIQLESNRGSMTSVIIRIPYTSESALNGG